MTAPAHNPINPDHLTSELPAVLEQVVKLDRCQLLDEAERAADLIASAADVLWLPKVPRKAEVQPGDVLHAIVCGIAILAQRPNGVEFGGMHWCANGHQDQAQDSERRADAPCPGPGEWTLDEEVTPAKARGAVFTPRSLAEEVTLHALEPLVYLPGPLETADRDTWRIRPSVDILALHVGDIAVGSGVFLLAACRYLAERLVEAWHAEAGQAMPDQLRPHDAIALAARRLAMRCLRGVDIDPTSVELARLSLALLAPTVPVDLSRWILCGDSLLGITSLDQLKAMHLDPAHSVAPLPMDPELLHLLMQVEAHQAKARV